MLCTEGKISDILMINFDLSCWRNIDFRFVI